MINARQLRKQLQTRDGDRLVRSLASNGTPLPLPLQVRLTEAGSAAPLAMGLRRLLELTYGSDPLVRELTDELLSLQHPDGSFPGNHAGDPDPLATAAAAAALTRLCHDAPYLHPCLDHACHRSLTALAAMQDEAGLFDCPNDRTPADRALTGTFILYLLGCDMLFRQTIRYADLVNWLDDHADRLDEPTRELWQMARITPGVPTTPEAPAPGVPTPGATPAIAA